MSEAVSVFTVVGFTTTAHTPHPHSQQNHSHLTFVRTVTTLTPHVCAVFNVHIHTTLRTHTHARTSCYAASNTHTCTHTHTHLKHTHTHTPNKHIHTHLTHTHTHTHTHTPHTAMRTGMYFLLTPCQPCYVGRWQEVPCSAVGPVRCTPPCLEPR